MHVGIIERTSFKRLDNTIMETFGLTIGGHTRKIFLTMGGLDLVAKLHIRIGGNNGSTNSE